MQPNQSDMETITRGLPSKSAKMRALSDAGYARADIARFMNTKYQFVRNVLEEYERRRTGNGGSAKPAPEMPASPVSGRSAVKLRIGPDGTVALPAAFREAIAAGDGDTLIASLEDGQIRLMTIPAAVSRAQAIVRQFVPAGVSLVEELLEDRRREVQHENS